MSSIDLGTRCLLEIQGTDAIRYLNGQVTQDVRLLVQHPDAALPSCVTDAKGRLQAYVTLYLVNASPTTLWIEAPRELRETLYARLSRYLIADDAEITDRSEEFQLMHQTDRGTEDTEFSHARFGVPGWDRWVPAVAVPKQYGMQGIEDMEALRIEHGVPRWGYELSEGLLPPEAGLDSHAISYQKGCYIGQEVISRMKSAGKVNRKLYRFLLHLEGAERGCSLVDEQGEEVGVLTSVCQPHAMGYLNKKAFGKTVFGIRLSDGTCVANALFVKEND
jgi:folate-binding protein YgfZ